MQLLVIRHAIAEDREDFASTARDDSERPLTRAGRDKMRRAVAGLRRSVPKIDVLAASPYVRAMQTARIVGQGYGVQNIETVEALVPDAPVAQVVAWLESRAAADVVAVVGHEPHLSTLVTWLIARREESRIELKKGGACLVQFDRQPAAGTGLLQWLMTSRQLRIGQSRGS